MPLDVAVNYLTLWSLAGAVGAVEVAPESCHICRGYGQGALGSQDWVWWGVLMNLDVPEVCDIHYDCVTEVCVISNLLPMVTLASKD